MAELPNISGMRVPRSFCVHTGALESVILQRELNRNISCLKKRRIPISKSKSMFIFGDYVFRSLRLVAISLSPPRWNPPISVSLDIVSADLPALFGL